MSEPIADIAVRVGAIIQPLKDGMNQASRSVGDFAAKTAPHLRETATRIAKVGAAATAAGAAIVAGLYVKGSQAIDAQAKLARSVGSTVVSVQSLERAAELAGIAQDAMGKSAAKLNQRIGEAIEGTGEAKKQFDALGLSAIDLSKMQADERFAAIADRIRDLGYNSSQAANALRDFGIREENVVGLMIEGGDAFRSARKEVEDFGLAVSDVDAAQVEAANDAMTSFGVTLRVVANTIAIQLAPYMQEIGSRFGELSKNSNGFKGEVSALIEGAIRGFGKLGDVIQGLRVIFKGLQLVAESFGAAVINVVNLAAKGIASFADLIVNDINLIIAGLNKLPNVEIAKIDPFSNSEFMKGLDNLSEQSRIRIGNIRSELQALATDELPSVGIERFLSNVTKRSQETAAAVVASRNQMVMMPEDQMGGGDSDEEGEKKKQEQALEAIKQRYVTEQELLREHRETMALIGEEYDLSKFETEEEWRSVREQAEQDHLGRLADIRRKGMSKIEQFQAMSFGNQVKTVTGALANMTAGVASENKRMFELNKKAGIANAIISAYQGIAMTLGTYPFPLSAVMAAAQAVAAFAQVNAIRSQSFGSGGGAAPSIAGSTPATPTTNVQTGTPQGPNAGQTMRVEGLDPNSLFSGEAVQKIAQGLVDFQKDGGQVVFAK